MSNKSITIGVRVTPEQKALIDATAKHYDMSPAEYLRSMALEYAVGNVPTTMPDELSEYDSSFNSTTLNLSLTKEQNQKIENMVNELGITKQQCIRRLINEGKIYDCRINIDMAEEFTDFASEIRNMNKLLNGIYKVCKRSDGILTKREVDHLYNTVHEINENTASMRASLFRTNAELKEYAIKRMDKLIRDNNS